MLQLPVKFFRQLDWEGLRHLSELSNLSLLCRVISLSRPNFNFTGAALFEIDRFRRKEGREIKPLTVQRILDEEIGVAQRDLGVAGNGLGTVTKPAQGRAVNYATACKGGRPEAKFAFHFATTPRGEVVIDSSRARTPRIG